MLKSLEELKDMTLHEYDALNDVFEVYDTDELVDKIQAEIDRYYLPRPLFDDGEPADFGMEFSDRFNDVCKIRKIVYLEDYVYVFDADTHLVILAEDDRLKRPPEPDRQEKIDADSELTAREYCDKHGIDASYDPDYVRDDYPEMLMRRHLLERQRKLDGVE